MYLFLILHTLLEKELQLFMNDLISILGIIAIAGAIVNVVISYKELKETERRVESLEYEIKRNRD